MARKRPADILICAFFAVAMALSHTGCGPTYPKDMVDEAIVQLCREEYGVDVKVKIIGNTVGVYIPISGLFDNTLNISKEAAKQVNDVILSVSRVTLSTDADLDYYIVIAQDPMLPEIEVVLMRYVMDVKMLHYDQISRGEFVKRMIVAVKLTPQAQKEKVLRNIFGRLNIEEAGQLIEEYLQTSEVASLGDIGYWQDTFYIKDINMSEFLALQIADRAKAAFNGTEGLRDDFKLTNITGEFLTESGKRFFRFSFQIEPVEDPSGLMSQAEAEDRLNTMLLKEASDVFKGYKFYDFWNIEIVNLRTKMVMFATSEELKEFDKDKIKKEELRQWYR